jgi:hypothetical protein
MSKIKDVKGEVYNRFTIIENLPAIKYGKHSYKRVKALCECGNERDLCYKDLKRGKAKSCGCINAEIKTKVAEGDVYNLWTVIKETEGYFDRKGDKTGRTFLCRCVCGKEKDVNLQSLKKGVSKSCGCQGIIREEKIKKEKVIPQDTEQEQWKESYTYKDYYISTLGNFFKFSNQYMFPKRKVQEITFGSGKKSINILSEMYLSFVGEYDNSLYTPTLIDESVCVSNIALKENKGERYNKLITLYGSMKTRCNNPNNKDYKNYGGRGIKIDESFDTLDKFVAWAISVNFECGKGLTIDRKNNDGNYSSDNCRFVTRADNNRNQRKTKFSVEIVDDIRTGKYKDISNAELGKMFNTPSKDIKNIREFKSWNYENI